MADLRDIETARVHGRLSEAAHIAGYTFNRALDELKWLCQEERWKSLGFGDDGAAFASSIQGLFKEFKGTIEQRREVAQLLAGIASQRKIAAVLGVDESTVREDLGKRRAGNPAQTNEKTNETKDLEAIVAGNPAPAPSFDLSGAEVAKLASRASAKKQNKVDRRERQAARDDTCSIGDLGALIAKGARFGTIYADPPWLYDNQGTRAATGNHYDGMTVDELVDLPIGQLAADSAHLHLWTTNGFLFECPRLFAAWGFEFRSTFIWVKPQLGIGNYWRNSHEILLTAVRGDAKRFNDHNLKSWDSWIECGRGAHSAKPEQVRHMIEKASPGPFLELFGRTEVEGWTVWGNEVRRSLLTSWNTPTAAE